MNPAAIQEWLNGQGQPTCDEKTCAAAATDGRLDILRFLRALEPPCAWDASTCTAAAFHGHLGILQWLHHQQSACPYDNSAVEAAAVQGHVDVVRWLFTQHPATFKYPKPSRLHLNTLKAMTAAAPLEKLERTLVQAACHAAVRKDQEITKWSASLDPDLTLRFVRKLVDKRYTCAISFMHALGCLEFDDERQDTLCELLVWSAGMGDVDCVKEMKDVLLANDLIPASACAACKGRVASILPDEADMHEVQQQYWTHCLGEPDFLALAEWLVYLDEAGPGLFDRILQELDRDEEELLLVELLFFAATTRECQPEMFWSAEMHRFTAAHAAPALLRWLLEPQGLPRDYITVHPDCSSARMLLLVHGHGWQVPAALTERLEAVEKRLLALHSAARQQHQKAGSTACLGHLPQELIKEIACNAGIDFSWSLSDPECS